MTRRDCLKAGAAVVCGAAHNFAVAQAAPSPVPIINGGEHAWVLRDPRFAINPNLATCPSSLPSTSTPLRASSS